MSYLITEPESGRRIDIDYFLEWRPRLWRRPFLHAIGGEQGLHELAGKRVLEVGCRYGKMSCLFGLFGATVVGMDVDPGAIPRAQEEVKKHNLADRVRCVLGDGDVRSLNEGPFDMVFTKSVLYFCKTLDERLGQFHAVLRPGGRGVFVENYLGSALEIQLRYHLLHKRWMRSADDYVGIRRSQLPIFRNWFDDLRFKSFWRICCSISGVAGPKT